MQNFPKKAAKSHAISRETYAERLLKIGEQICATDYAVRHFHDPQHRQFYLNSGQLLKALRRAIPGLPKRKRGCYIRWIEAIMLDNGTSIVSCNYESCGQIIAHQEQLKEAILSLPEEVLEQLMMDAGWAMVEINDRFGDEYGGYAVDDWMAEFHMEPFGAGLLPDDPRDKFDTGCHWRKTIPSLRDDLSQRLSGKKQYATMDRLCIGLIELVDYLNGKSLKPFWHYADIALMVEKNY